MSDKAFRKECVLQECPTKVSPTRELKIVWALAFGAGIQVPGFHLVFLLILAIFQGGLSEDKPKNSKKQPIKPSNMCAMCLNVEFVA